MSAQKNVFTVLGEWWDIRQAERTAAAPSSSRNRWLRLLPTPGNVVFTLLMIGLLLWAQTAGALPLPGYLNAPDAPSTGTIAYQGRLADSGGNPLTAVVNMEFRLYSNSVGGVPLWEEPWTGPNAVQVSDGLFNVMLGSLTPVPQSIVTGNTTLWLGITAGTDDEMTPRVQLGSVPFAVQALTVPDGSVTTGKIADGAVTDAKLNASIPKLLNHKTCDWCGEVQEQLSGWNPVKGSNANDIMEVTVVANGGPLLVHTTARYTLTPGSTYMCAISVVQNGTELRMVRLEGNPYSTGSTDWACSGSYLFTDLPAGTYTFRSMAWVGAGPIAVTWVHNRQIAAYQF